MVAQDRGFEDKSEHKAPRAWQGLQELLSCHRRIWVFSDLNQLSEQLPNFCRVWAGKCCLFHFNQAEAGGAEQGRIKLLLSVVCYWHLVYCFELF